MNNQEFLYRIGEFFGVYDSHDAIELETWTDGGVNMVITLHKDAEETLFNQFRDRVIDFDIDEEIDLHRNDPTYRDHFTYERSVNDFKVFKERLEGILKSL